MSRTYLKGVSSLTTFIAVYTKVGAAGFSDTFFDRSSLAPSNSLDVQQRKDLTGVVNFYISVFARPHTVR